MLREVLPLTLGAAGTRAWDLPLGGAGERESERERERESGRLRAASPERAAGGQEGKSGEGEEEGEVTESGTWRIGCGLQPLCFYL